MAPAVLSAQSAADEIETLLKTGAVTYSAAARFLLEASETLAVSDPAEAFRYAMEQGWLTKKASADDAARLDEICLLLMRAFGINGGLLFSVTGSPHFAYRELVYREIIQGRTDPHMNVSGERLLFYTDRVFHKREN